MSTRTWIAAALLLGALFSGWTAWRHNNALRQAVPPPTRSNYVLHDFELISLDENGKESFTLRAPFLQETPGAKTMELTTPVFDIPDANGTIWQAKAKTGFITEKRDRIDLNGEVLIASPADATRPVRLQTEQMQVFPNDNRATSRTQVTVTQPGSIMRGVGFEADFDQNRVTLLSQVKGQYAPSIR